MSSYRVSKSLFKDLEDIRGSMLISSLFTSLWLLIPFIAYLVLTYQIPLWFFFSDRLFREMFNVQTCYLEAIFRLIVDIYLPSFLIIIHNHHRSSMIYSLYFIRLLVMAILSIISHFFTFGLLYLYCIG